MKIGGDPFRAADCHKEEEERLQRVRPNDGEKLVCRSAFFPKEVKTLGGAIFKAGEQLVIVRFHPDPYPRYVLMGGMDRRVECKREAFRLVPLSRRAARRLRGS